MFLLLFRELKEVLEPMERQETKEGGDSKVQPQISENSSQMEILVVIIK